jgi:putative membrane protein
MLSSGWARAGVAITAMAALSCAEALAQDKAAALTDANIAAIVVGANTIDAEYGRIAKEKSTNAEVRTFAETMIATHEAVNRQATELAAKLGLRPVDNETSKALAEEARRMRERLRGLSGRAFDRAYIDNEVAFHQKVLDAIDGVLIPGARNPELKALLESVRPAIVGHLEHAKRLQATLGS